MIFNTTTPAGNAGGMKRHNLSNLSYLTSQKEDL